MTELYNNIKTVLDYNEDTKFLSPDKKYVLAIDVINIIHPPKYSEKNIESGCEVEYIDTKFDKTHMKTIKVKIYGIWDGTKVICNDKDKTTIRNIKWLRRVDRL